jgi:plasmid stability protein
MKTTVELPDDLLRRAKAQAALQGRSMKDLLAQALRAHLDGPADRQRWRLVFGKAEPDQVAEVDAAVAEDLETIDLDTWR